MFLSRDITKWSVIRQKGKRRFIFVNGVLGWGFLTAILFVALAYLIMPEHYFSHINFVIVFIVFPIAGFLWGLSVWYLSEREFTNNTKSITRPHSSE